jgi:hypothetical protein
VALGREPPGVVATNLDASVLGAPAIDVATYTVAGFCGFTRTCVTFGVLSPELAAVHDTPPFVLLYMPRPLPRFDPAETAAPERARRGRVDGNRMDAAAFDSERDPRING